MRLSKNFTLDEFLISQTAERHGIDMTPPPHVIDNLQRLVGSILQPLRDETGHPIVISSGYRPEELNDKIGGSPTSAHVYGCASDLRIVGYTPLETCELIREMDLPYDQVIHEFGRWVHVGIKPIGQEIRRQELTAFRDTYGQTRYTHGLLTIDAAQALV